MKRLLLLLTIFIVSCSSRKTVLTEQVRSDYLPVLDSIQASGTFVSPLRTWSFITDENRSDEVLIGTLYKEGESTGSIQIRKVDSVYNIKIIDVFKSK